jgi:hypothetical protein
MFDLHRDYLMSMLVEERLAEAARHHAVRHMLRQRQAPPTALDRMLAALGNGLVRAGGYLQRRGQVASASTLLLR